MTLVLVGAPGSGKSTIGARLARRLDREFVDVDAQIVAATGREIADIFARDGEAAFRELEREHTLAALATDKVVSLGGGAVLSEQIRAALAGHSVIWLQITSAVAAERVGLNVARPLLLGNVRGRLNSLLAERTPLYTEVATHTIDASGSIDEVTAAVLDAIEGDAFGKDAFGEGDRR